MSLFITSTSHSFNPSNILPMDRTITPSSTTSQSLLTGRQRGVRSVSLGPSKQALAFIRQFARVYRIEAGLGMVIN